ncbi:hypothetical protein, partial [Vibrio parahaemolyticus]|uniref:hypothetical protein n=1 Tax=Vibrio parahaemolyticus TaxID=670 RepID=UPI001BAEA157
MARYMIAIAHDQGISLQFECDLGSLAVPPNAILINHYKFPALAMSTALRVLTQPLSKAST